MPTPATSAVLHHGLELLTAFLSIAAETAASSALPRASHLPPAELLGHGPSPRAGCTPPPLPEAKGSDGHGSTPPRANGARHKGTVPSMFKLPV